MEQPATLTQGCVSEAQLEHGCDFAPVAGTAIFLKNAYPPLLVSVVSAADGQPPHSVKATGKTGSARKNAALKLPHILISRSILSCTCFTLKK